MPEWSSYAYTFNNPVKFADPTGMVPEIIDPPTKAGTKENEIYIDKDVGVSYVWDGKDSWHSDMSGVNELNAVVITSASGKNHTDSGNTQGNRGWDWSGMGNTLTAGGVTYYSFEKSINNSKYWVDAKGGIRSTELLERGANGKYVRGVQGLRNSRAAAANAASKYAVAGKVVGGLGIGVTLMQYGTGQISGTEASIDLIMGGIGFTGWGAPISLLYFGGKFLYEYSTGNTLFEKPRGQ